MPPLPSARLRSLLAGLLAAGALAAGCGSSSAPTAAPPTTTQSVNTEPTQCGNDHTVTPYDVGVEQAGSMGRFKAKLMDIDPLTPVKGSNSWTVQIVDANEQVVPDAVVTVSPFMPDHGHGTSIQPTVTPMGPGVVELGGMVLFMPGYWAITLTITSATKGSDLVVFGVCVAG